MRDRLALEYNIEMDLKEIGLQNVTWVNMVQCAVQWRAALSLTTNFLILQKMWGIS